VQVPFKEIRFFLRKDSRNLCRKFPGIGNPRAGEEDQWTFISNFPHLETIFRKPGNNLSIILF
jgi:hypothetical protein